MESIEYEVEFELVGTDVEELKERVLTVIKLAGFDPNDFDITARLEHVHPITDVMSDIKFWSMRVACYPGDDDPDSGGRLRTARAPSLNIDIK